MEIQIKEKKNNWKCIKKEDGRDMKKHENEPGESRGDELKINKFLKN